MGDSRPSARPVPSARKIQITSTALQIIAGPLSTYQTIYFVKTDDTHHHLTHGEKEKKRKKEKGKKGKWKKGKKRKIKKEKKRRRKKREKGKKREREKGKKRKREKEKRKKG